MPIRQLAADVAAKIAAGEVVERPASVVKELLENALDAGARNVRVELTNGGLDLLRVSDDGCGIAADELALAFLRHATSKLATLADLERIGTLGFRGEALASIAAVARVTLVSRTAHAAAAAQLVAGDGALSTVTAAGAPPGTSVTIRALFAAIPARLKFLKTRATETGHALHLIEQYALAYPEVRFTAISEGRTIFASPGDGSLASVLVAVYGLSVAEQMVPLAGSGDLAAGAPAADDPPRVSGYVSRPSCYKSTRQYLSFFVNRRWVQSRTLAYAVEEAYHSLLLAGRHPLAVVNIALDPALLDVNIHPAKTEIRFLRERQVYAAVQRAVRAAVLATAETPAIAPHAFAVPAWEMPRAGAVTAAPALVADDAPEASRLWPTAAGGADAPPVASGYVVPGTEPAAPVGGRTLPVLRVLGQLSQSYIITEGPDGVYLVDQHAAHERILLERIIAEWQARTVAAQLLLQPLPVELSAAEREAVDDHAGQLSAIGFEIEPFGETALLVRAVPGALAAQTRALDLRALLLDLAGADAEAASHGETWEEHALANVACKAAIKAGQSLSPQEQRALIEQLEGASAHQSCCHGRPTMVHLSLSALERQFDRR
ncbi:MAG: DNA mismatch repair endonuclease MutL [Ktedonobacterales bacterium]